MCQYISDKLPNSGECGKKKKKCNTLHYSVDFFSQNECNVYNARLYWLNCKMIMKWYLNVHCILVNQLLNCLCSVCTCTLTSSSENEAPCYIVLFSGLIHIQIFLLAVLGYQLSLPDLCRRGPGLGAVWDCIWR